MRSHLPSTNSTTRSMRKTSAPAEISAVSVSVEGTGEEPVEEADDKECDVNATIVSQRNNATSPSTPAISTHAQKEHSYSQKPIRKSPSVKRALTKFVNDKSYLY